MPTTRKKRKHSRRQKFSDQHVEILLSGRTFFADQAKDFYLPAAEEDGRRAYDMDAIRRAWQKLRGELLPKYIAEYPGRRPWAWWKFDAPDPRRQCLTGIDPYDAPDLPKWASLNFGICRVYRTPDPIEWETEAAYLARHDLLAQPEKDHCLNQPPKN